MEKLRELFDPSKPIDRRIEKVITYDTTDVDLLRQEIQEYVVTDSIEQNIEFRIIDERKRLERKHRQKKWPKPKLNQRLSQRQSPKLSLKQKKSNDVGIVPRTVLLK